MPVLGLLAAALVQATGAISSERPSEPASSASKTAIPADVARRCVTSYRAVRILRGEIPSKSTLKGFAWPSTFEAVQRSGDNWAKRESVAVQTLESAGELPDAAFLTGQDVAGLIHVSVIVKSRPTASEWLNNFSLRVAACDEAFGFSPAIKAK